MDNPKTEIDPEAAERAVMASAKYRKALEDLLKNLPPQGMDAQDWHEKIVAPAIRKTLEVVDQWPLEEVTPADLEYEKVDP